MNMRIVVGDITEQRVDAIVNAANRTLLGGGGADGAIHRAAGRELLEECRTLGGARTGEAKLTKGYKLPAKFVIHTVGPVYQDGRHGEAKHLANCYRNSLLLAKKHGLKSIVFPAISTGAYAFPKSQAAKIAINTVRETLKQEGMTIDVVFVLFTEHDAAYYRQEMKPERQAG